MLPTPEQIGKMAAATKEVRKAVAQKSFGHFVVYYFSHYLSHPFGAFQKEFMNDLEKLKNNELDELAAFGFRACAKTSLSKIWVTWLIANGSSPYICVDSYDRTNAERFLFDVIVELQSNRRLTDDYGRLFDTRNDPTEKTQKRISDFLTANGVRVEAHTTQEPVRGRLHGSQRPSTVIFDDTENRKTVLSEPATRAVMDHFNEAKPGMDPKRNSILYLGNYLSETGSVNSVMTRLRAKKGKAKVHLVPIVENVEPIYDPSRPDPFQWRVVDETKPYGPTWPERYCLTDGEAKDTNKISIQKMRRDMYDPLTGEAEFLLEMLCRPEAYRRKVFSRSMFTCIDFTELKKRRTRTYFAVDSGGSGDGDDLTGKDRAGFAVAFVEDDGHWDVKAWGERLGPTALVSRIIDIHEWLEGEGKPCHRFAWEKTMFTVALLPQLKEEMRRRNRVFPVIEIRNTRKKEERIKGALLHRYETGMIRHIKDECHDLERELLMFPEGEHDDVIDGLAILADGAIPKSFTRNAESNEVPVSKFL